MDLLNKHKRGLSAAAAAAALLRLLQQLVLRSRRLRGMASSAAEVPFSAFLADARAGALLEVLFGPHDFLVTAVATAAPPAPGTAALGGSIRGSSNGSGSGGGKLRRDPPLAADAASSASALQRRYRTVPVPAYDRAALVEELATRGVRFAAQRRSQWEALRGVLMLAVPFIYLACVGYLMHHMQHPRDDGGVGTRNHGHPSSSSSSGALGALRRWLGLQRRPPKNASSGGGGLAAEAADGEGEDGNGRGSRGGPRFSDVAGAEGAKRELLELVHFLQAPGRYHAMGCRMPRGLLLSGPAGTGKTMLARALAAEAGVPFFSASASEFVETLVGRGAARVRDLFRRARAEAPCMVFIDEVDTLGKARGDGMSHGGNDEREQTLNQILTEMDGFEVFGQDQDTGGQGGGEGSGQSGENEGVPKQVLVLAATNRPHVLDPALLRPGRFDRHVRLALPDTKGRAAILRSHARRVKLEVTAPPRGSSGGSESSGGSRGVDLEAVASATDGMSGAELANVINEAALLAVRSGAGCVTQGHLAAAVRKQRRYRPSAAPMALD